MTRPPIYTDAMTRLTTQFRSLLQFTEKNRQTLFNYGLFVLATILLAVLPPTYRVSTKVLLPQLPMTPGTNITVSLGLPPELYSFYNPRQPTELYLSLAQTDSLRFEVAKAIVAQTKKGDDKAIGRQVEKTDAILKSRVKINALRGGLIEFQVEGSNLGEISYFANIYSQVFIREMGAIQKKSIARKRKTIEERLESVTQEIEALKLGFTDFRGNRDLFSPENQVGAGIGLYASVSSALALRQAQLAGIEQYETGQNQDVMRLRTEIASLEKQLAGMETSGGKGLLSVGKVSKGSAQYFTLMAKQKHLETIQEAFKRAVQISIFEESASVSVASLVDLPTLAPERVYRTWVVALALLILMYGHRAAIRAWVRPFLTGFANEPESIH